MEPLTREDCINKVKEYFKRPGAVLAFNGLTCVYRESDNPTSSVRCAFGVLIPDERYIPEMEGKGASYVLGGFGGTADDPVLSPPLTDLFADEVSPDWIDELQALHDVDAGHEVGVAHFLESLDAAVETGRI